MASISKPQWLLIAGALTVTVLIFLAPRVTEPPVDQPAPEMAAPGGEELATKARGFLPDSLKLAEQKFSEMADSPDPAIQKQAYDSLSDFWGKLNQPVLAANYAEQAAKTSGTQADWKKAADLYLLTARNTQDESRRSLYNTAIRCFETAIEKGDSELDTRVDLASCYVEAGPDAMKGIGMLREVLEADSTNVKAHLNLGYFSIQSGQYDKAIERFRKVLELDPSYHDAYVYLGDVYERNNDIPNAIKQYELFRETVKDSILAGQIDRYLEKLRKSINH